MPFTFKRGNVPGEAAKALGASWQSLVYVFPDGKVVQGSALNPYQVPIGAVAYTPAEYANTQGSTPAASTTPTTSPAAPAAPKPDQLVPGPITDVPPIDTVAGSTLPQGGKVVVVRNPAGSDAAKLWYIVYNWRGVELAYEVGDDNRFIELFGPARDFTNFNSIQVISQSTFDSTYTSAGSVETILGSTESLGSQIEREIRAAGLEDLPPWLAASTEGLALVAEATAQGWSSGRLWQQLSQTQAFADRYGDVIDRYLQGGTTISQAVKQIESQEQGMKAALLHLAPPDALTIDNIHQMLARGWTPDSASKVLEQASVLSGGAALTQANEILDAVNLPHLDEVGFINALNGHGPPNVVEALNTIAAGQALSQAGLGEVDTNLLMEVVNTSDRLLTVQSFQDLAQQISFNLAKYGSEIDRQKLGLTREDVIAGIFGEQAPSGRSPGETLNLLLRFERDRQAAAQGFEATTAGINARGRLQVAGLQGL